MAFRKRENYKPQLKLKESLIEFFKSPLRYLKASLSKESAFEKPYLDLNYNLMHLDIPAPDWPTWKFPPGPRPKVTVAGPDHCVGCALSGFRIRKEDCETHPVNIHGARYCVPQTGLPWVEAGVRLDIQVLAGEAKAIVPGRFHGIFPDYDIWLNPDVQYHVIQGIMVDGLGNVCTYVIEQECETCDVATALAFDDGSTPDTIDPGGNITLYITGTGTPFTWSVSGVGYTLASAETEGLTNTLTSASGT